MRRVRLRRRRARLIRVTLSLGAEPSRGSGAAGAARGGGGGGARADARGRRVRARGAGTARRRAVRQRQHGPGHALLRGGAPAAPGAARGAAGACAACRQAYTAGTTQRLQLESMTWCDDKAERACRALLRGGAPPRRGRQGAAGALHCLAAARALPCAAGGYMHALGQRCSDARSRPVGSRT